MVKHTQTVRRQIADELFECVLLFCGIGAESVKIEFYLARLSKNTWKQMPEYYQVIKYIVSLTKNYIYDRFLSDRDFLSFW